MHLLGREQALIDESFDGIRCIRDSQGELFAGGGGEGLEDPICGVLTARRTTDPYAHTRELWGAQGLCHVAYAVVAPVPAADGLDLNYWDGTRRRP